MKTLTKKTTGISLMALLLSVLTGCASVQPTNLNNEKISQTIGQTENLPSVRSLTTQLKPKANLLAVIKKDSFSMGFDGVRLEDILATLGSSGNFNVLVDRNLRLDRTISTRLINMTVDETLQTVLNYDCLSYKVIDNNAVYIYKDPQNSQCKTEPSQDKQPQSLMNGKPFSMHFGDSTGRNIFAILEQMADANIVLDDKVYLLHTGVYQNNVKPNIILNRLVESNCLSFHKIGENTLFIYEPENQKCEFTPLKEAELAKIPELQKTVTFDGEIETNFRDEPLGFWHYLFKIGDTTQTDMIMKDVIDNNSKNYGKIQVKATNQPAYKVLEALAKANCFDIAQLSDKSLFLYAKPQSDKCEPIKNGTIITVE